MKYRIGGSSFINGILFYTNNFIVKSIYEGDNIKTTHSTISKSGSILTKLFSSWLVYSFIILSIRFGDFVFPLLLFLLFIGYLMFMKFSEISKFHGAEHKVLNAYDSQKKIDVEIVMSESRLSRNCGTNFIVYIIVLALIAFLINQFILPIHYLIVSAVLIIMNYIYFIDKKFIHNILKPFIFLGILNQKLLGTREPDLKHVNLAIITFNKLLELQEKV